MKIGKPISNPNDIYSTDFDYIIIAVEDIGVYSDIYKSLIDNKNELKGKLIGPISITQR